MSKKEKLSLKLNEQTNTIKLITNYLELVSFSISKEKDPSEKGMALYLALENDGALKNITEQLLSVIDTMTEASKNLYISEKIEVASHD